MTRPFTILPILAVVAASSALGALHAVAQKSQLSAAINAPADAARQRSANIPSTVDAPVAANRLLQAFRDASALTRVDLLEQVDASPALNPETTLAVLREALTDDDRLVREAALRALIRRDDPQNPALSEADLEAFQGEIVELARVHLAARNADATALKDLLQHGDAVVQQSAFEALAATDLPGAIEALHAELRDAKSLYRLQTLQLLTTSGYTSSSTQLLPILLELSADPDPLVRDCATQALKDKADSARSL